MSKDDKGGFDRRSSVPPPALPDETYRRLVENVQDAIFILDPAGVILYISPAIEAVSGYRPAEVVGRNFAEFIHPADREELATSFKATSRGETAPAEFRCVTRSGEFRWCRSLSTPQFEEGRLKELHGVLTDITTRKRKERIFEHLASFPQMNPAPLLEVDFSGRIKFSNNASFRTAAEIGADEGPVVFIPPDIDEIVANFAGGGSDRIRREVNVRGRTFREELVCLAESRTVRIFAVDVTERARSEERLKESVARLGAMLEGVIGSLSMIGELRDPFAAGHQGRVAALAQAMAAAMGIEGERAETIRVAAFLHDIGKVSVPAELLGKPGRLTPAELGIVKAHAGAGYEILRTIRFAGPVALATLQHHERLDGSGYPGGLRGDAIIVEARVLAVADTVEAMASHRPYRPALGVEKAIEELRRGRGDRYDAAVVDACVSLFEDGLFSFD